MDIVKPGDPRGSDPAASSARQPRPRRRSFVAFLCWTLLAGLLALVAGEYYISVIRPPGSASGDFLEAGITISTNPGKIGFGDKDHLLILCLGTDDNWTRKDILYTKNARSDTIFVVALDRAAKSINVLSIPRDTWVRILPGGYNDRVNSAYAVGGVPGAEQTIGGLLGVSFDQYCILKISAAVRLIDALGGLPIDVEKDMNYDDNWGHLHIHLKKGPQVLNGEQAVGYARFRHDPEGDWGRIRRQQQVLHTLIQEMKQPRNWGRLKQILQIFQESFDTNFTLEQMADVAYFYKNFDRRSMRTGVMRGSDAMVGGAAVLMPDEREKDRLVRRLLLGTYTPQPADVTVEILNGTATKGFGWQVAARLRALGYRIAKVAEADRKDYATSKLIAYHNDPAVAALMGQALPAGIPVEASSTPLPPGSDLDFTLVVGQDLTFAPVSPAQATPAATSSKPTRR